jgi:large subunit ribosomal protein L7/L12
LSDLKGISNSRIAEKIDELSASEAAEHSKMLEGKWGVSVEVDMADVADADSVGVTPVEVKNEYAVFLSDVGNKKIEVIKTIREITGMNLKNAKELVENSPTILWYAKSIKEAEEFRRNLFAVGGGVKVTIVLSQIYTPKVKVELHDENGDLTTEDWNEIKLLALDLLAAEQLDTPSGHLGYIRQRISRVKAENVWA